MRFEYTKPITLPDVHLEVRGPSFEFKTRHTGPIRWRKHGQDVEGFLQTPIE